jgi:hypothetical protein
MPALSDCLSASSLAALTDVATEMREAEMSVEAAEWNRVRSEQRRAAPREFSLGYRSLRDSHDTYNAEVIRDLLRCGVKPRVVAAKVQVA